MRVKNMIGLCAIVVLTIFCAPQTFASSDAARSFNRWTENYVNGRADFAQGIELAKERRALMRELIRTNPAEAIRSTMPQTTRDRLPPEILAQLETVVSGTGDLIVLGAMRALGGPAVEPITREARIGDKRYRVFVYGRWSEATTRKNIFLEGVALDDDLALAEPSTALPNESSPTQANQNVLIIRVDFSDLPGDPQCSF